MLVSYHLAAAYCMAVLLPSATNHHEGRTIKVRKVRACLFVRVKQSGQRDLHDIEPEVEKLRGRESAKRMRLKVAVAQMKISIDMDS